MKKILFIIATVLMGSALFAQTTYTFDKNQGSLTFSATAFGTSTVDGRFKSFKASLKASKADFSDAVIEMTAEASSIFTDNKKRDNDLRGTTWLDAQQFPVIKFESTSFTHKSGNDYQLSGNITIHGVEKPIVFDVVYGGVVENPETKSNSVSFTVTGKLNRTDFGVGYGWLAWAASKEITLTSNVVFLIEEGS